MRLYYHNANLLLPIESGVHARSLLEGFHRRGHEVLVYPDIQAIASAASSLQPPLLQRLFQRMPLFIRDRRSILAAHLHVRRHWPALRERIVAFNPDAIYMRTNYNDLISLKVAEEFRNLPLVLEVNSLIHQELQEVGRGKLARFTHSIERSLWQRADAIRVVSGELKKMLAEAGVDPAKIHVIHSGADIAAFSAAEHRDQTRVQLAFQPSDVVFCYIGTFRYFHGLDELVEAARLASFENARLKFLMIGDGPRRASVEEAVARAGLSDHFTFTGSISHDQIPDFLSAADVCLSVYPPTQRMYFCPLKLLEYLAAAKPVIASAVGVQEELLTHRQNAWLVPLGDAMALAQAMKALAADPALRRAMGQNAATFIREQMTWDHTIEKIEALLSCKS